MLVGETVLLIAFTLMQTITALPKVVAATWLAQQVTDFNCRSVASELNGPFKHDSFFATNNTQNTRLPTLF